MKPRKVLIMGSDFGSLDMVLEAKRRGLYVITADLMNDSPTKQASDESWLISTKDIDALERKCIEEGISAVAAGVSDMNTTFCRELCKRLNLPMYCESDFAWSVARNKRLFKDICLSQNVPVADDYKLSSELTDKELNKVKFPVVVKPIDKSGNRGMSYCNNKDELINAIKYAKTVSDNGTIICERELRGTEFAANYIIANGEPRLLYFSSERNQPGEKNNIYSIFCTTSNYLKQWLDEMNEKVINLLKTIGCSEGIAWVETIRDADGHFYLIEMGYRFGGEMIYSTYNKVIDFNIVGFMLDCALGIKHTSYDLPPSLDKCYTKVCAAYFLFTKKEGNVKTIKGLDEIEKIPNIIVDIPKREGSHVGFNNAMGVIRMFGNDINELIGIIYKINSSLVIKDEDGDDLFIYYTDFESLRDEYYSGLSEFGVEHI